MKRIHALTLLCAIHAHAAGVYTEHFSTGMENWYGVNNLGNTGSWQWESGTAVLTFAPTLQPFDPTESSLTGNTNASSGYLTGSLFVAGYPCVGFDFIFETAVPTLLQLELASGATTMQRNLIPNQGSVATQQWYRAIVPLDAANVQYWSFSTTSNDFDDIVNSVDRIAITIKRPTPLNAAHTARVDNIFLAALPYATTAIASGSTIHVTWQPLREGSTYRLEEAESLITSWTPRDTLIASNGTASTSLFAGTNAAFFRLTADIIQPR